jgi:putative ABC transport system ATP-binding protein
MIEQTAPQNGRTAGIAPAPILAPVVEDPDDGAERLVAMVGIGKMYQMGEQKVHALRDVSLRIDRGEFVAIMGASGGGKSTLMNIMGCLDRPTAGSYHLEGRDVARLGDDTLAVVRNRLIGFVFQQFNLLPRTSALKNVELPLVYAGARPRERAARARAALETVGLGDRLDHQPSQLSGGQQQRVAMARALVTDPSIIMADEPTGALDSRTTVDVMNLFQRLNQDTRITIIMVTHEEDVAAYAGRVVRMRDGQIVSDESQQPRRAPRQSPASEPV